MPMSKWSKGKKNKKQIVDAVLDSIKSTCASEDSEKPEVVSSAPSPAVGEAIFVVGQPGPVYKEPQVQSTVVVKNPTSIDFESPDSIQLIETNPTSDASVDWSEESEDTTDTPKPPTPVFKPTYCFVSVLTNRAIPIKYNGRSLVLPAKGGVRLQRNLIESIPPGVRIDNCL